MLNSFTTKVLDFNFVRNLLEKKFKQQIWLGKVLLNQIDGKRADWARFKFKAYINTLIIFLLLASPFFLLSTGTVVASQEKAQRINSDTIVLTELSKPIGTERDQRVKILREYLRSKGSPMVDYADEFVEAADKYKVDWRLVPSITGVESTFGKFIPGGHNPATISYNGWGWGVYGDQSLGFRSWDDGINTVTKGLKENYINKGLTDPYAMNRVYASSPVWGQHVDFFMHDLDKFTTSYKAEQPQVVEVKEITVTEVAGDSAGLKTEGLIASK